ncbi:MAG: hypothetical protein ACP6IT_11250 [Candidatus Thorarchaeota archaeon]
MGFGLLLVPGILTQHLLGIFAAECYVLRCSGKPYLVITVLHWTADAPGEDHCELIRVERTGADRLRCFHELLELYSRSIKSRGEQIGKLDCRG